MSSREGPSPERPSREQRGLWMGMARLVAHLAPRASAAIEEAEGITLTEMTVLGQSRALGGTPRMVDLAETLQLTRAAITKLVDGLEARGLAERGPDEADGRVVRVHTTEEGRAVLGRAERVFEAFLGEHLWRWVDPEETRAVVEVLERVQRELGLRGGAVLPPG